jgi:serine/threonine protein kinase
VLYSCKKRVWKIADFGLTAEGSKKAHTTRYSRGTPSYRAPELVKDGVFSNKVDIWAMGCILYELIFSKKTFSSDNAVYHYSVEQNLTGVKLNIPWELTVFPDGSFRNTMRGVLFNMLEVDFSKRWSAQECLGLFNTATMSEPSVIELPESPIRKHSQPRP